MSQAVNINDSKILVPNGYTHTGSYNFTVNTSNSTYNISNAYNNSSNTSKYARLTLASNSSNTRSSTMYIELDKSGLADIPSGATITSVACKVRYAVSSTSYVTAISVRLYSNTTAKGSAVTSRSTTNATSGGTQYTVTAGSWTLSELQNIRLYLSATHNASTNSAYVYFYGADITVSYSFSTTQYDITSTLATDAVDSIIPAGLSNVYQGGSYELEIYADSINDFKVEDNNVNVTSSLVRHTATAGNFTFTGVPVSYDSTNSQVAGTDSTNVPSNGLTEATSGTRAAFTSNTTANSVTRYYYNFDCSSIPANAIINSVSCTFKATASSNYFDTRVGQLCTGTTAKGSGTTITNTSVNNTVNVQTISNTGTWTREELNNIKIMINCVRNTSTNAFTLSFYGATLTINYTVSPATPYYWTYSLSNIEADHTIIISDSILEIPEEDPQYEYYPITISSINATTNPGRGTTRVVEGTNQTIEIYPSDPLLTLVTDNGVDVSSQLVQHGNPIPDPTVATLSGASYGFNLNSSTGYYVSTNTGVSKSASVCRVSFNLPVRCLVTFQYINYAEATYDFGVFGNIDTALSTSYYAAGSGGATITDASYKLACNTSAYNLSTAQTLTYEVPSGQHYIDIKYSKDDASDSGNDTLQWKITNIEALDPNNYYTYTLSNISQSHSLIFIFGDVTYYFANSSGSGCKLYPSGSIVQLPGDTYTLTIVPEDYSYEISVTDNNVDVTSSVERVVQEVTKDGITYTVVNYIYRVSNIQATHTIAVDCHASIRLYIKIGGNFVQASKVYKKISGNWVETSIEGLMDTGVYIYKSN